METIAINAAVSAIISAAVSAIVSALRSQGHKAQARSEADRAADEALKAGMRELLWSELKSIHERTMREGGLTVVDRKHLDAVYAAYHGLLGNGTGTRLYEDAMRLPVID